MNKMTPEDFKKLEKEHGTGIAIVLRRGEEGYELTAKDLRKLRWLRNIQKDT